MNANKKIIGDAFENFRLNVMPVEIIKELKLICQNLLISAIHYRLRLSHSGGGHDFTGNLINSIVVVLYQDGEIADVWAAGEHGQIKKPICRKMTARKKAYYYSNDYSNTQSKYRAEIETNRGVADEDIEQFLNSNAPSVQKGFCVTVAYTVEYAEWVEIERQTTGYVQTKKKAVKLFNKSFKPISTAA